MIYQNISKVLDFYLFAGDTNIYYESNSLQDLERKINKELGKLQLWLNVNRLALNIRKTNYVIFHPFNKPLKQKITLKIRKKSTKLYKISWSNNRLCIKLETSNKKYLM